MRQNVENAIVYSCLAISLIAVIATAYFYISPIMMKDKTDSQTSTQVNTNNLPKVRFTEFDKSRAIEFMDSNNDGMCDFCGMRIEDCMASGMMQCTMDSNSEIGLLKSSHHHADVKIYLNNQQLNLADPKYFVKSSFVHVENDGPEKTGNVIHVHATSVDLKFFLESLGIKSGNLKEYINGNLNSEGLNYIPTHKDKILITDSVNQDEINKQLKTITSFSI